jgi:hypothetical protein
MIKLVGFALAVAMVGACASIARQPGAASSARESCPPDQPAPKFVPAPPSGRDLAIVTLRGSDSYVVRDITDINHPFTVSTLPSPFREQFVSASELTYLDGDHLYRAPLAGAPGTPVTQTCWGATPGVAWTRDGTTAAYMTLTRDYTRSELHIVGGGHDRLVATARPYPWGVGCEGAPGQHCEDISDRTLYSPDGTYISFVENWGTPMLRIWTSDGKLLKAIDGSPNDFRSGPTMSVWSGSSLYWRDSSGVEVWRDGRQSLLLPGVSWIAPTASAAGGQIVFEQWDAVGMPSAYLLDTATGAVRLVTRSRSSPAFLTSRYVWYRGERACAASDPFPCNAGGTTIATGKTYLYDLQTGAESESIITALSDVWPHPA